MNPVIAKYILAILFAIGGMLALFGSIANWDWLFESRNAKAITCRMSRNVSRLLYGIAGVAILTMTTLMIVY